MNHVEVIVVGVKEIKFSQLLLHLCNFLVALEVFHEQVIEVFEYVSALLFVSGLNECLLLIDDSLDVNKHIVYLFLYPILFLVYSILDLLHLLIAAFPQVLAVIETLLEFIELLPTDPAMQSYGQNLMTL